jgi:hypothetical protein
VTLDRDALRAGPALADAADEPPSIGEPRWPPVFALLLFMALHIAVHLWVPGTSPIRVVWLVPTVEGLFLVLLITAHPVGRGERRQVRRIGLALVGLMVVAALWATGILIRDLIHGTGPANRPGQLLATAGVVWLGNNLAFGLLYWLLDSGGPMRRMRSPAPVDFAFTQQMSPEPAPPGWRPVFLDYLHLGFTNATAFSPTDVMPLTHRAKYTMLVQSTVALALFALVVARAVNAFT